MNDRDLPEGFRPDDPTAGDTAYTDHAEIAFVLKEYGDGAPWIMLEPRGPTLPVLRAGDAFLGLTFYKGVHFKQAQALAEQMRTMLRGVSYTKFTT